MAQYTKREMAQFDRLTRKCSVLWRKRHKPNRQRGATCHEGA